MGRCHLLATCVGMAMMAGGCLQKIPCYPPEHYAPPPEAPYTAEDVRVPTKQGHTLAGTLTLPATGRSPYPGVLLISGSSPQDRDHLQSRRAPVCLYKPFRQIADALSRRGIAVLRMDDQGVGCSQGGPPERVPLAERADDSRAGIAFLRGRQDIDGTRIALLGLSEGANIGPMVAASDPAIRAVVMMAPTATSGYKIIEYQRRCKLAERTDLSEAEKEQALAQSMHDLHRALAHGEGSPHFRSFIAYMPLPTAQRVACPALILHGDRDAHIPFDHAYLLANAMRAAGNADVTVLILKDHNHLFLEDPDGAVSGYQSLLPHNHRLSDDILSIITDWLENHL